MKSKFWQNNRSLTAALFAVLAVNWWLGFQPSISGVANMASNLPPQNRQAPAAQVVGSDAEVSTSLTTQQPALVFADTSSLNGCTPGENQVCSGSLQMQSGKTKEDVGFSVTFGHEDVGDSTDYYSGKKVAGHAEKGFVISMDGCDVCGQFIPSSANNQRDALMQVAKVVNDLAKRKVQHDEQARLDELKQKKIAKAQEELDKAVERCEKKDDGTTDDNGMPTGTKISGDDKLDCMVSRMEDMDKKDATKYYTDTLMPFLNQMLGSNNASDRESANNMLANILDAADGNTAILQSVSVLQRVSSIQDQIFTAAQRIQASANNPIAKVAATQQLQALQSEISSDPVLQTGGAAMSGGGGITALGAATASHWQADLLNTIQLASVNPAILANQSSTTLPDSIPQITDALTQAQAATQVSSLTQNEFGHGMVVVNGRQVQNLAVPVPGSAGASSVLGNPCYTSGVGANCQNVIGTRLN